MILYDFSVYAQRKKERDAAKAVVEVVAAIEHPGSIVHLKSRVNTWFDVHREVLKQGTGT